VAIKGIVGGSPGDLEHAAEEGGHRPGQQPAAPLRRSDEADVSALATVLRALEELQRTDPSRFGEVLRSVAGAIRAGASGAAPPRAELLRQLAERFERSAREGSLPLLSSGGGAGPRSPALQRYGDQGGAGQAALGPVELARLIEAALG